MFPLLLLLMRLAPLPGKSADRSSLSERRLGRGKEYDVRTTFRNRQESSMSLLPTVFLHVLPTCELTRTAEKQAL